MKITISFSQKEIDLYNFLKSKRSASVYIKDLLQVEIDKENKEEVKENKIDSEEFYMFNDGDLEE